MEIALFPIASQLLCNFLCNPILCAVSHEILEVKIILKALGFQIEKSELIQLMKQYDPQQTGEIEYLDYVDLSISNK